MKKVSCPFCGSVFESVQGQSADHPLGTCPLSNYKLAVEQWNMRPPNSIKPIEPAMSEVEFLRSLVTKLVIEEPPTNYQLTYPGIFNKAEEGKG